MDVAETIEKRKSIRAYKQQQVPRELIKEIIDTAVRSASWANSQPWEFVIAGGQTVEEIQKACEERVMTGATMNPDIAAPPGFPDPYDSRRRDLGRKMFEVMGIGREDKEKRMQWGLLGFKLFGAPNVIYILTDRSFYHQDAGTNVWPLFDCGLVAQNIMLLATMKGLGTIPEIQAVAYPDILRKILDIPDSKLIVLGIAIGYPDSDHPINKLRTEREAADKLTSWKGF